MIATELRIDDEFKALLWPLSPVEYSYLESSIERYGCRDKLTVWRQENCLVDGHNRYEICGRLGIDFEVDYIDFDSREQALDWIDKHQAARRNCTPEQYKIITGRIYNRRKKPQGGTGANQHEQRDQIDPSANDKTAEQVAKEMGVSAPTVKRDGQRAEVYDEMLAIGDTEAAQAAATVPQSVISDVRKDAPAIAAEKLKANNKQLANTGEIEWYTPVEFVEMARSVMGGIDLDPASCKAAQKNVRAEAYYSAENDGLSKEWSGRVWLNPPYRTGLVERFVDKLIESRPAVKQAVVLVNNGTETRWFQKLLGNSACVCFPSKRISFINSSGAECSQPNHAQAFFYFGNRVASFVREFSKIGICMQEVRRDN